MTKMTKMTTKTSKTIIVTLLTIFLASSVSALDLTLQETGGIYATSGTWNYNFDSGYSIAEWDNIIWEGSEPANTNIQFRARTAADESSLSSASWSSYIETSGEVLNVNNGRWMEVEVHLSTTDTSVTPVLYNFTINYAEMTEPTFSSFDDPVTTNLSDSNMIPDITNVTNLTLAKTGKGKIKFSESTEINAFAQDYDTNIVIEDKFISVDTAALDSSFNTSATLTLEGVVCPVDTITYQEGTFTSKDDIIAGGKNCVLEGVCSNVQCTGTTLTFDVAHFTGFAAGADANLTIEAEAGVKFALDDIEFYAWYVNSTDGSPISGTCNIKFDDAWGTSYTMDFNGSEYNYTKAFDAVGTHDYNVTCSSASFVTVEANDSKLVSSVDIPEFSMMTLGLGLIAVLIGLFVIRKKNNRN